MAQLERVFSATGIAVSAGDNTLHTFGFPAIPANSAILVTGIYIAFDGTYTNNQTGFFAGTGVLAPAFYYRATGVLTEDPSHIIDMDSQIVLTGTDTLQYKFDNDTTGNLDITVFYKLIPNQNLTLSVIFENLKGNATTSPLVLPLVGLDENVAFYKSLIITNFDASTSFTISRDSTIIRKVTIADLTSHTVFLSSDYLYQIGEDVELRITTASTNFSYMLSFYFDPLYKA